MDKNKKFVSRAGEKLQYALEHFHLNVKGKVCADLGSSTGGFVDCLLQNGAQKVYAVEIGYGVLDWSLRNDPRVVVMERTSALSAQLPEKVDFVSIDVGWTKQKLIVPCALKLLKDGGEAISLLKTHYEAKKKYLVRGRVREEYLDEVVEQVKKDLAAQGVKILGIASSPLVGGKGGNREFLLYCQRFPNTTKSSPF